jgi:hypothetical protein
MSQISRPFQIALAAVALLGLVWAFALHRPSSSSSEPKSSAESPAATVAPAKAPAASSNAGAGGSSTGGSGAGTYHGSAPGVEGLSIAIAKAHGAVATSQQNAKQLQEKSEQASSNTASTGTGAATPTTGGTAATSKASPAGAPAATTKAAPKVSPHSAPKPAVMPGQRTVERELARGDIVALLFWSPRGAEDGAVRASLRQLAGSDHRLAVHVTAAKQVASFGTITRGVQVYGTPTILIVGKHGHTQVLTGLQDAFAIRQAVSEARHP